jgi:hypothetical protein
MTFCQKKILLNLAKLSFKFHQILPQFGWLAKNGLLCTILSHSSMKTFASHKYRSYWLRQVKIQIYSFKISHCNFSMDVNLLNDFLQEKILSNLAKLSFKFHQISSNLASVWLVGKKGTPLYRFVSFANENFCLTQISQLPTLAWTGEKTNLFIESKLVIGIFQFL